jgi:hypothetical protein
VQAKYHWSDEYLLERVVPRLASAVDSGVVSPMGLIDVDVTLWVFMRSYYGKKWEDHIA